MSGFDKEEDYIQFRTQCLEIKRTIEKECGFKKIYYAGEDKPSKNNFSVPRVAVVKDLKALRSSKRFLLIHPGKIEGVLTLVEN